MQATNQRRDEAPRTYAAQVEPVLGHLAAANVTRTLRSYRLWRWQPIITSQVSPLYERSRRAVSETTFDGTLISDMCFETSTSEDLLAKPTGRFALRNEGFRDMAMHRYFNIGGSPVFLS